MQTYRSRFTTISPSNQGKRILLRGLFRRSQKWATQWRHVELRDGILTNSQRGITLPVSLRRVSAPELYAHCTSDPATLAGRQSV